MSAGRDKNARLAWAMVAIVGGMLGLAYAAAPLYEAFCKATGFAGTPLVAKQGAPGADRPVIARTVEVDRQLNGGDAGSKVHLGEEKLVFFRAINRSQRPIVGTATYNVTPEWTAGWFNKIQCFCFTEQLLQPGQSVDMPVLFFVDADMDKDRRYDDIRTITLSYTFYEAKTERAKTLLGGTPANGSGEGG